MWIEEGVAPNGKKTDVYQTKTIMKIIKVDMLGDGVNSLAKVDYVVSSAERPQGQQGRCW